MPACLPGIVAFYSTSSHDFWWWVWLWTSKDSQHNIKACTKTGILVRQQQSFHFMWSGSSRPAIASHKKFWEGKVYRSLILWTKLKVGLKFLIINLGSWIFKNVRNQTNVNWFSFSHFYKLNLSWILCRIVNWVPTSFVDKTTQEQRPLDLIIQTNKPHYPESNLYSSHVFQLDWCLEGKERGDMLKRLLLNKTVHFCQ